VVMQLAQEFGAYVIGTGRAVDRRATLKFGANEFLDLDHEDLCRFCLAALGYRG